MELVKELPEIFEEFAEQRQRSFLVMKEVKDKGIPVVGASLYLLPTGNRNGYGSSYRRTLLYIR